LNADKPIEHEFPFGAIVYHKTSGEKAIVMGHTSYSDGTTFVVISLGFGNTNSVMPELITTQNPEFTTNIIP